MNEYKIDYKISHEELITRSIPKVIDFEYGYYIKTQNVTTDEKLAIKKFIEFVRTELKNSLNKDNK